MGGRLALRCAAQILRAAELDRDRRAASDKGPTDT